MQHDLGLDNSQAGVLATANLVGYLLLALFGGALAAKFGPRIVIAAGMTVVGVGMLLTGVAQSFFAAGAFRALTGVGSGASNVPVRIVAAARSRGSILAGSPPADLVRDIAGKDTRNSVNKSVWGAWSARRIRLQ
jgi:MFS family permease